MNKVEEAIEILQNLPEEKARVLADAIIDAATPRSEDLQLSDEQVVEIERRINEPSPRFITLAEAQARLQKLRV
ncbi:hypothetical protein A3A39_03700 [Candidatus Kaiserbacteria bacterium RIFCSPLOWO2_01_FULL_54_13]|uniref:Addiction module protein n=1 Tax=Candidatus Kaiserbacteria bacterium RIFCSPLOWO2_01_FULL_54_13 TaxID=1798512 RepID=A0A1F6F307_9BACT|nr:MAG: hypothetical protein A3A39_03700 [Candidatus Kaiserbacteria bacterium RIFCSPLOWO2_01_FULL_54_13]